MGPWSKNLILCCSLLGSAATAAQTTETPILFHADLRLESEALLLQPAKVPFVIFVTWQCPEIEGWQYVERAGERMILNAQGERMNTYPERLRFRISVNARSKMLERMAYEIDSDRPVDDFQSTLQFRLLHVRGVDAETVEPVVQKMIGVPAEAPSDNRVYRIEFDISGTPIRDRLVLEVRDADGQRVAKFPVFFY